MVSKGTLKAIIALFLISQLALASNGTTNAGTGSMQDNPGEPIGRQNISGEQAQRIPELLTETTQVSPQESLKTAAKIKEQLREREPEMEREIEGLGEKERAMHQNQNRVMLAVHALLAVEDRSGGIGQNISQIARQFNNSAQKTIEAEERIQKRNAFSKMLFGGDEKMAGAIEAELNQNRVRLQELKQLIENCSCDEETKQMLQEHRQNMEQEQERLKSIAQEQRKSKGLLGWIWK
jgi:hypothetical protein